MLEVFVSWKVWSAGYLVLLGVIGLVAAWQVLLVKGSLRLRELAREQNRPIFPIALLPAAREAALRQALEAAGMPAYVAMQPAFLVPMPMLHFRARATGRGGGVAIIGLPMLAAYTVEEIAAVLCGTYRTALASITPVHRFAFFINALAIPALKAKRGESPNQSVAFVAALANPLAKQAQRYAYGEMNPELRARLRAKKLLIIPMAWESYTKGRLNPTIHAGALPPVTAGFADYLDELKYGAGRAYRSIDSLWLMERKLMTAAVGKARSMDLNAMSWQDVESLMLPRITRRAAFALRLSLAGKTIADIPALGETWNDLAREMMEKEFAKYTRDVRRNVAALGLAHAATFALGKAGWELCGLPDRLVCRKDGREIRPGKPVTDVICRRTTVRDFAEWADREQIGVVPLWQDGF